MNDGAPVQVYPFPAMALSTMAFAVRILGCSYIIDGITTEEVWVMNERQGADNDGVDSEGSV
jgi:hypothetical protein